MKPISETPTQPRDYAVLSATYGSLLTAVAIIAHRRRRLDALNAADLAWAGLATFALSQALVHEKIEVWLRAPFLTEEGHDQQDAQHNPKGSGLR